MLHKKRKNHILPEPKVFSFNLWTRTKSFPSDLIYFKNMHLISNTEEHISAKWFLQQPQKLDKNLCLIGEICTTHTEVKVFGPVYTWYENPSWVNSTQPQHHRFIFVLLLLISDFLISALIFWSLMLSSMFWMISHCRYSCLSVVHLLNKAGKKIRQTGQTGCPFV